MTGRRPKWGDEVCGVENVVSGITIIKGIFRGRSKTTGFWLIERIDGIKGAGENGWWLWPENRGLSILEPAEYVQGFLGDSGTFHVSRDDELRFDSYCEAFASTYHGEIITDEINKPIKKKKTIMKILTNTLKKILPGNIQTQYKAGFRNGDIELTDAGVQELLAILAEKFEKELTARADEIVKEELDK